MENHPVDTITLDQANPDLQDVQDTYGYIDLERNGLNGRKIGEIVLAMCKENPAQLHPIAAYKIKPKVVELVFGSREVRENLATNGLNIFQKMVIVERPKP